MTNHLNETVYRAFEERHSWSLNRGSRMPETTYFVPEPPPPQRERATDFCLTEPITEQPPSDAVLLLLITDLARHVIRSRTSPYRVRRDRPRSAKAFNSYFVPSIEYELHWSALGVWHRRYPEIPAILRQGQALHPATLALIETTISVAKCQGKPMAHSREEYDWLRDDQLICNAIAERMRAWAAHPANAMLTKAWEARLDKDKDDFLARWTPAAGSAPHQLLRFDLAYAGQTGPYPGFGAIPADVVKNDLALLREELTSSPNFSSHLIEFFPYADLTVMWMIPGVSLVPAADVPASTQLMEIRSRWQRITGPRDGRFEANYTTMEGNYRYVSDEQRMLDPLWLQLSRAATYLFDTRLIFDSSLPYFASKDGKRNQLPEQNIYFEK